MNIFTVTFGQFDAPLLSKSISFFLSKTFNKILTDNHLKGSSYILDCKYKFIRRYEKIYKYNLYLKIHYI